MSADKTDLARAGTMQVTAKEGKTFLTKNLTEWKKPYLMDQFAEQDSEEEEEAEEAANTSKGASKKAKLAKHSTMKGTAKEAAVYFADGGKPDDDVFTRGQQKKLQDIKDEKPKAKKSGLGRANTMHHTAKEGKDLLGGEKLGDTRLESKKKKSAHTLKRASTSDQVLAEAKAVYGSLDTTEGRSLRKRAKPAPAPKKSPMKKKGTMVKTAKEGKDFLKRSKKAEEAAEENDA